MTRKLDVGNKKGTRTTFISFLLDETGSMNAIKDDTIGGFNAYIDTLKKDVKGSIKFTLMKFDSSKIDVVCSAVPLKDVPELTKDNYRPGAATNLIDAAVRIIRRTEDEVFNFDGEPNVMVIIQTDGYENASHENTNADLQELIKEKTKDGWAFNYIGAGIDAYKQAGQIGIGVGQTMSYDMAHSQSAFQTVARASTSYSVTGDSLDAGFTDLEKQSVGDNTTSKTKKKQPRKKK